MDISNINGISTGDIKSFFNNTSLTKTDKTDSFSDVLSAAMGSIGETNDLQNAAEQKERRVIELYYYEDLTLKEISNILEVSESRVSQLHTKGLIKMRKVMGPYMNILTNA